MKSKNFQFFQIHLNYRIILVRIFSFLSNVQKYPYPPPSLSKELGLKANEILGEELYVPAIHDPEVYHLSTHLSDLQMVNIDFWF